MSSSTVEKIKERLDIADVVGSYVELKKMGATFKARCPFHNERTPSFVVSPDRGTYYCFGCHAKGDIFSFVQEFEGIDFKGALKQLADRAGVALEAEDPKKRGESDRLYSALDHARAFYAGNLSRSTDALAYLQGRGIREKTISDWSLGLALPEWRSLYDFLKEKKFSDHEMLGAGLIKRRDPELGRSGDAYYDTFRNRIVFPIFDATGRTVGFSGRTLSSDPNTPKYLNSPETALFNKSEILYGLHKAKGEIRRKDYAILVEGQMDLVMCHQAGYGNTVASSGTALTSAHIGKLMKLSPRMIMAFDSDAAGIAAAEKAAKLALGAGADVKIAALPSKDPADLIKESPARWAKALSSAKHVIDFELDTVIASGDPRNAGKGIREKVLPFIARLVSTMDQSYYVSLVARRAGIKEEAVWNDLKGIVPGKEPERRAEKQASYKSAFSIEKRIMGILHWKPELEDFRTRVLEITGEDMFLAMKEGIGDSAAELVFETEAYYAEESVLKQEMNELLLSLERRKLQEEIALLQSKLRTSDDDADATLKLIHEKLRRVEEVKRMLTASISVSS